MIFHHIFRHFVLQAVSRKSLGLSTRIARNGSEKLGTVPKNNLLKRGIQSLTSQLSVAVTS